MFGDLYVYPTQKQEDENIMFEPICQAFFLLVKKRKLIGDFCEIYKKKIVKISVFGNSFQVLNKIKREIKWIISIWWNYFAKEKLRVQKSRVFSCSGMNQKYCMMGLVAREPKSERTSQHTLSQWHSLLAEKSHTHKREWGKHVTLITKFQGGSEWQK